MDKGDIGAIIILILLIVGVILIYRYIGYLLGA